MYIFVALLIYISIAGTSHINSFWKIGNIIHKLIEFMIYYRFQQIVTNLVNQGTWSEV